MKDADAQLAGFFARYEPPITKLGQAARKKLRARLPGLHEIVYLYENKGSFVLSYSPTERGFEALCSLALYPDEVRLYFARAPELAAADPQKLLRGTGKTVRYLVLGKAQDLERAAIAALLQAAVDLAELDLVPGAEGTVIVKAEEQAKRATRAKKGPKPAAARQSKKPRA